MLHVQQRRRAACGWVAGRRTSERSDRGPSALFARWQSAFPRRRPPAPACGPRQRTPFGFIAQKSPITVLTIRAPEHIGESRRALLFALVDILAKSAREREPGRDADGRRDGDTGEQEREKELAGDAQSHWRDDEGAKGEVESMVKRCAAGGSRALCHGPKSASKVREARRKTVARLHICSTIAG